MGAGFRRGRAGLLVRDFSATAGLAVLEACVYASEDMQMKEGCAWMLEGEGDCGAEVVDGYEAARRRDGTPACAGPNAGYFLQ